MIFSKTAQLGLEARAPSWHSSALSIILLHQTPGGLQRHLRDTCRGHCDFDCTSAHLWEEPSNQGAAQHPCSGLPGALASPAPSASLQLGLHGTISSSASFLAPLSACSPPAHFYPSIFFSSYTRSTQSLNSREKQSELNVESFHIVFLFPSF